MTSPVNKNPYYFLFKLGLPIVLMELIQAAGAFFQTIFFAHLGHDVLTVGALSTWLFGVFFVMVLGILGSIKILITHKNGENDLQSVPLLIRDGLILAFFLAIFVGAILWKIPLLFPLFGYREPLLILSMAYFHALVWGLLPSFILIVLTETILGLGQVRIIFLFMTLFVAMAIFLSVSLMFGKFGMPSMGISGAAWGSTISYWVTTTILFLYLLLGKTYGVLFRSMFKIVGKHLHPSFIIQLLKIGLPMGMMFSLEIGFFFALNLIMGSFSEQLLDANQIVLQYLGVVMTIVYSFSQAITIRMGYLLSAKQYKGAEQVKRAGLYALLGFTGLCAWIYCLYPESLISADFDINDPNNAEIVNSTKNILKICALYQLVTSIRVVLFSALRAVKDTQFPFIAFLICFWGISLPGGYILETHYGLDGKGLWLGMLVGSICNVFLLRWRYKSIYNLLEFVQTRI